MPKPSIIEAIEHSCGEVLTVSAASSSEAFMVYGRRETRSQYLLLGEQVIGLKLRSQGLQNIPWLDSPELHGLQALCLCENKLEALTIPATFSKLEYLDLSDNEALKTLQFEGALPGLRHLDVSDCGLEGHLKLAAGFDRLVWLDASRNKLQEFVSPGRMGLLEHLDLSGNQLREFSAHILAKLPALQRLYLNRNPLPSAKLEAANISGSCLNLLRNYLHDLIKHGETKDKEFKVILVGNGGVGKSCLVEQWVYGTFEKRHLSTNGVVLEQYPREPSGEFPYLLNLWDFAGQDIYHATHRLFMQANAIYLALWDEITRTNTHSTIVENGKEQPYENFPLDYWLHYIRHQAGNSPAIVVKTKCYTKLDETSHPDRQDLETRYAPLAFLSVDSAKNNPKESGVADILHFVKKVIETELPVNGELPNNWAAIRQHLRTLQLKGMKALSLEEYTDIAADKEVADPQQVLEWLIYTGAVFHRKGYFGNAIMLDQSWAIDGVYAIFRRDNGFFHQLRDAQKGVFSGADLQKIWNKARIDNQQKTYAEAEQQLLLDFMKGCELCFEIKANENDHRSIPFAKRQFIAPQLLPEAIPTVVEVIEAQADMLHICYRHRFLHQGVIQRFIVRAQALADPRDMWLYGITLKENGKFAVVRSMRATERGSHAYDVHVICDKNELGLMDKIRNTLEELQGEAIEEWVSHNGKNWVSMAKLAKWDGKGEFIPDEHDNPIAVTELQAFRERREQTTLQQPRDAGEQKTEDLIAALEMERLGMNNIEVPELSFLEGKQNILFLQSNPTKDTLHWKDEHSEINKTFQDSDAFECKLKETASLSDFHDAFEDYEPGVLHFCGHGATEDFKAGTSAGLFIHNDDKNNPRILTTEELERLFHSTKNDFPQLQLVFLNACHSSEQARAISKAGLFTIGTTREITSEAARHFAAGVYKNLPKRDILRAIKRGVSRADLSDKDVNTLIEAYYNGIKIFPSTNKTT